jgi:hypothetical protein
VLAAKVSSRIAGRECVDHENGRPPSTSALRNQFAFSRHPSCLLATAKISDWRMTWSSPDCEAICIALCAPPWLVKKAYSKCIHFDGMIVNEA